MALNGAGPKGTITVKPQQQVGAMATVIWETRFAEKAKKKKKTGCTIAEPT